MKYFMKMSCEVVNTIGTGDCELEKNCKSERGFANLVATELVSEIIENALDIVDEKAKKEDTSIGNILDKLSNKFKDMVLAEDVPKAEETCSISPKGGIGDQLNVDGSIMEEEPVRLPPVEKKNRLTDLVKNSKHILAKLIMTESKENTGDDKEEKVMSVVDLDSGDPPFRVISEKTDESAIHEQSDEYKMEEIKLCSQSSETTPKESYDKKTMTFPLVASSSSSGKTGSLASRYRTLKFPQELMKKKKWNIGTKIVNYIRKHQKKGEKEDKKTGDGVEINPYEVRACAECIGTPLGRETPNPSRRQFLCVPFPNTQCRVTGTFATIQTAAIAAPSTPIKFSARLLPFSLLVATHWKASGRQYRCTMADLSARDVERANFVFSIYDFEGNGTVDAVNLGDMLRALNLNPTLATIEKVGGTKKKSKYQYQLDSIS
nr:unnamed protein product [Callosobruchus analis]